MITEEDVMQLGDVHDHLAAMAEKGLIVFTEIDGVRHYRALKAVCLRCNIRIQAVVAPDECPKCGRGELAYEGYVNEENPKYDNFDIIWEYAHVG